MNSSNSSEAGDEVGNYEVSGASIRRSIGSQNDGITRPLNGA
jgi:hypothetical protein